MKIDAIMDKIGGVRVSSALFLNRFTIRSILLAGFALVIVMGIFMAWLTEWSEELAVDAADRLIKVDKEISDLCLRSLVTMSNARRNEKDFILNRKEFGFSEAKSRYISRLQTNLADVKDAMQKIRLLADDPEVTRQTMAVEQEIEQYRHRLLVMIEMYGMVGTYDTGLEAEFRGTAHEMEDLLKGRGNDLLVVDLLSMRRREKDYIERSRDIDVAEFRKASARFEADVAGSGLSPVLKEKLRKLADTYRTGFERYAATFEEIRAVKKSYLKSVQVIEPALEKLYAHSNLKINETLVKINDNHKLIEVIKAVAGLLALLLSLAATFIVSMFISKSVAESRSFAEQVAAGNLEDRLAAKGNNEFVALASAMNDMAESLQKADHARKKWTAELYKSEEEIRKLNQELELKVAERTRELVEAQEELVRKEKLAMLGQLAGSVGNELRNPLGVMNNAVYFLKAVMSGADEKVGEYLEIIKQEIDNSQSIISDFLNSASTRPPCATMIPLDELIRQSLKGCVVPENVRFQADLPETIPDIKVDILQMVQVFQNLIINAVQALPEGGALRVAARRVRGPRNEERGNQDLNPDPRSLIPDPAFIEISIEDTGTGIAPENMNKIFQPLFTTKSRGVGLGLVVCKNLTEANGGRIEVESRLGEGTTFTVMLPVELDDL